MLFVFPTWSVTVALTVKLPSSNVLKSVEPNTHWPILFWLIFISWVVVPSVIVATIVSISLSIPFK